MNSLTADLHKNEYRLFDTYKKLQKFTGLFATQSTLCLGLRIAIDMVVEIDAEIHENRLAIIHSVLYETDTVIKEHAEHLKEFQRANEELTNAKIEYDRGYQNITLAAPDDITVDRSLYCVISDKYNAFIKARFTQIFERRSVEEECDKRIRMWKESRAIENKEKNAATIAVIDENMKIITDIIEKDGTSSKLHMANSKLVEALAAYKKITAELNGTESEN